MQWVFSILIAVALVAPCAAGGAVISVTTFGAIADDGLDDFPAINNAIQSAHTGDTIFIPAGTFDITQPIEPRSNMTVAGDSRTSTIVRFSGATRTVMMAIEDATNVNVTHLTLDGNNSTVPSNGLYAADSTNLNIDDIAVQNLGSVTGFSPHAIFFAGDVTNSLVQNTLLTNIGPTSNWGAGIRVSNDSNNNQIINNTIQGTGRGGILCDTDSTNLVIRNNTVTGSGLNGGTGLGIEVNDGCDRAVIEDNHIDHWLSVDASNQVAVRRNVISDTTFKYAGLELVSAKDAVFTDNVVNGGAKLGISISGGAAKQYALFSGNSINGASTWGMQIQGDVGRASKMYFYKNVFTGTLRNSPDTNFPPQGQGVRINGDSDHLVFDSNNISSNEGNGIQLISASTINNLTFAKNQVKFNGLKAYDGSATAGLTWYSNVVASNGSNSQPSQTGPNDWLRLTESTVQLEVGDTLEFSIFPDQTAFAHVLWDFGDGPPITTLSASHAYDAPGSYHVTMLAWNVSGVATFAQTLVQVGDPNDAAPAMPEPSCCVALLAMLTLMHRNRRPI